MSGLSELTECLIPGMWETEDGELKKKPNRAALVTLITMGVLSGVLGFWS